MSLFGDFKNSGSSFWSVGAGKFVSTALLRRRRLDKAPEPLASIPQPFPHPTRWYLLFYPRELFGGCTPGSYASMREVLDAKLDTLCLRHSGAGTGGAVAASECTRLPPKGMKMVESGFDSEASFLHHCLENGRVDRTGAEYTCMLRPRGPTASMSPARSGG